MKISSILAVVVVGLLTVSGAMLVRDWYLSQPPNFEITVSIPADIKSNVPHTIPAIIDNGTRERLRIVGWTFC